jgi:hypothetical protein
MSTYEAELAIITLIILALWLGIMYVVGRLWSWQHNRKRWAYRRSRR